MLNHAKPVPKETKNLTAIAAIIISNSRRLLISFFIAGKISAFHLPY
jgi:hypothetical protein